MTTTTYSFKAVCDRIYDKLKYLEWKRVAKVYNSDIKLPSDYSFPSIIITPNWWNCEILDSCSWKDYMVITVRLAEQIYNEYNAVEQNMREIADIILNCLKEIDTWIGWSFWNGYTVKAEYSYNRWYLESTEPIRLFEVDIRFTAVQGLGIYVAPTTPAPDNNNENENNW